MNIYFYTNQEIDNQAAKDIVFYLKRAGIEVVTENSKNRQSTSDNVLPKAEAIIFQGKSLDAKSNYLLAFNLAQNKKALCLLPEGAKIDSNLSEFRLAQGMSDKIMVEFYNAKNLKEKVYNFLKKLDQSTVKELFNIKYTLRVSKKINEYLNWKAKTTSTPKADWLRDRIIKMMEEDSDYQDFAAKKFDIKDD